MTAERQQARKPKAQIVLRSRRSRFVDIFRTTPVATVCPNFFVLAHANGCAFAPQCSYCYLKTSFRNARGQRAFTNLAKLKRDIRAWLKRDNLESYVLNSGNLSDSLSFEACRPLIRDLVELFRREAEALKKKHTLLLVTKGGQKECGPLFRMPPCRNVVISFSVNAPEAARRHEAGAPPVADRLEAARRLQQQGWRVRMRIDPMIKGFDYRWITEQVRRMKPERVTLGTLRAETGLDRFVGKGLLADLESPAQPGGLSRYPRATRLALYRQATRALRPICPIGLCEETKDIWQALKLRWQDKPCNCGS